MWWARRGRKNAPGCGILVKVNRVIVAGFIGLTYAVVLSAQAPASTRQRPRTAAPAPTAASTAPKPAAPAELTADAERDLLNRYCVSCHSERAKAAGVG